MLHLSPNCCRRADRIARRFLSVFRTEGKTIDLIIKTVAPGIIANIAEEKL
jgi:hypothetical protein